MIKAEIEMLSITHTISADNHNKRTMTQSIFVKRNIKIICKIIKSQIK